MSGLFYRHPRLRLALLLGPPLAWLLLVYIGSLVALLAQSFYRLDSFTGTIDRTLGLDTWRSLFTRVTWDTVVRTVAMAIAVTAASTVVGFPIAYLMAKRSSPRIRTVLYLAVLMPVWASYIVRVYSWRQLLERGGVIEWFADRLALRAVVDVVLDNGTLGGASLLTSFAGQFVVFTYIWLPYMVLPVQAALDRVPASFLEASADLGSRPWTTFRLVTWPLAVPGVAAGSIFTFSLTLGDYIIPTLVGPSRPTIGQAIYRFQGVAGNLPLAAAFTVVPMAVMAVYLLGARRAGAFEAL